MTGPLSVADDAAASVVAVRAQFPAGVVRSQVGNGQMVLEVTPAAVHAILAFLKQSAQGFDYLTDLTCVEYRDPERQFEVVYQLRSLARRVDLRVKVGLDPQGPLEVPTVTDLWHGAEWLEREAWDMFGVVFAGHGDLRRILMWETYSEGHPLRKSFPLRGHWSRAEQTRQALNSNPEVHYSLEELSITNAYTELPEDMQARLAKSGRGALP